MKPTTYSNETQTVIGLFERLPATRRKYFLEKILDLMLEQESESKWEDLLENHPEPMIRMANRALHEHKRGRSKPMKL